MKDQGYIYFDLQNTMKQRRVLGIGRLAGHFTVKHAATLHHNQSCVLPGYVVYTCESIKSTLSDDKSLFDRKKQHQLGAKLKAGGEAKRAQVCKTNVCSERAQIRIAITRRRTGSTPQTWRECP